MPHNAFRPSITRTDHASKDSSAMQEKTRHPSRTPSSPISPLSPTSQSFQPILTWSDTISPQDSRQSGSRASTRLRQPWRHSISRHVSDPPSHTVREFRPQRQRQRLFVKAIFRWCITLFLCGLLAACLGIFGQLLYMTVGQIKAFNALIVLLSLFLGNNLTSSLREFAVMFRWRLLASKYRPLLEFDLLMHCESLRKVMKLFVTARTPGRVWFVLNRTQWLCFIWLAINLLLQILVALLGLTYNLNTSDYPTTKFGHVSISNLTIVRDIWGSKLPTFDAQLGSANSYGIQGQDYNFTNGSIPGQGNLAHYGTPGSPTIYQLGEPVGAVLTYAFQDQNIENSQLTLVSHRNISCTATCTAREVIAGGNGTSSLITYLNEHGAHVDLNVARVGPGAMTYIGVLNSTCGPRCTQVMALQSANGGSIPKPSFFVCQNTVSPVQGIEKYLYGGEKAETFELPDEQAKILAGAIGWTGFNYTDGDLYQYVRYTTNTWWSPDNSASVDDVSERVMEFSIEAIAAIDYNGPRLTVQGWYPVTAQAVNVEWRWAASILGLVPLGQLIALVCVIIWSNTAVIRDESCLSTARLLRPIVEKLGGKGCLLSGEEIAELFPGVKIKYGWREPTPDFVFRNEIDTQVVRHVDVLEEQEGLGRQGTMPAGLYDGLGSEEEWDESDDERTRLLQRSRRRRRIKRRRSL